MEQKSIFPNVSYEAIITLILKPDQDIITKLQEKKKMYN